MRFLNVEHDLSEARYIKTAKLSVLTYVELAHILEVLVQRLYHVVDELEEGQLVHVVVDVDTDDEVQRCVAPVNHFILPMLEEGALVLGAGETLADELSFECDALLHAKTIIVLAEPRLALLVDHQDELDHGSHLGKQTH